MSAGTFETSYIYRAEDLFSKKLKKMTKANDAFLRSINRFKKRQDMSNGSMNKAKRAFVAVTEKTKTATKANSSLAMANKRVDATFKKATTSANRFSKAVRQSAVSAKAGVGAAVGKMGMMGAGAGMIGGGYLGKQALDMYLQQNKSFSRSMSIMSGVTAENRQQMKTLAVQLSEELPITSSEAAGSYYYLASAGMNAQKSIAALPLVAKFATAGMFDMSTATDLLTDAQTALGMAVDDPIENMKNMKRVADGVARASELANDSMYGFSEMLTNDAAAKMKALNVDFEQGLSVLTAYANAGNKGSEAGNMFGRMLVLLTDAARKNKGAFKAMGISVYDAGGNIRDMSSIFADFEKTFAGKTALQKGAMLEVLGFEKLSQKAIMPLIGQSATIAKNFKELKGSAGAVNRVVTKVSADDWVKVDTAVNSVKNSIISLTAEMSPLIVDMANGVKSLAKWFSGLSPEVKKTVGYLGLAATALSTLGVAMMAAKFTIIPVLGLLKAIGVWAVANPIGLIVTAVAGLSYWMYNAYQRGGDLKGMFVEMGKDLNSFGSSIIDAFKPAIKWVLDKFSDMAVKIDRTIGQYMVRPLLEVAGALNNVGIISNDRLAKMQKKMSKYMVNHEDMAMRKEQGLVPFAGVGGQKSLSDITSLDIGSIVDKMSANNQNMAMNMSSNPVTMNGKVEVSASEGSQIENASFSFDEGSNFDVMGLGF